MIPNSLSRALAVVALCVACVGGASAGVNTWTTSGPPGGNYTDFEPSSTDKNVYYAAYSRSLFRSTDGGVTWQAARHFVEQVNDVAVDPTDGNRLYVAVYGDGIYRSEDGGVTFTRVVVDPSIWGVGAGGTDGKTVYYSTGSGTFFRSLERGDTGTWTQRTSTAGGTITHITVEGASGDAIVAIRGPFLARSPDGGGQWTESTIGPSPDLNFIYGVVRVSPTKLVAGTTSGIYSSADDGVTWSLRQPGLFWSITLDPTTPGALYAANNTRLYRSTDEGTTWVPGAVPPLGARHVEATNTSPLRLVVASSQGVQVSTDGGTTWKESTPSPVGSAPFAIATTAAANSRVYAYTTGEVSGLFSSAADNGWKRLGGANGIPGNGGQVALAVKPGDANTVFLAAFGAPLHRSTDGGSSWAMLSGDLSPFGTTAIAFDPANAQTMYASLQRAVQTPSAILYRSTDGGMSWTPRSTNLPAALNATQIVVDPANTSRLYVAGNKGFISSYAGGFYRSLDAGVTWTQLGYSGEDVQTIALDPSDSQRLYAATSTGLQVSTDGGASFTPNAALALITLQPLWSIVVDPTVPSTLWVTTYDPGNTSLTQESGFILRSVDRGQSWETLRADTDQPRWYITGLMLDPNVPSLAYVPTGGRGMGAFEIVNDLVLTNSTSGAGSFDLRAENHGTFAATASRIVVKLPPSLTGVTPTPSAGTTCSVASSTLTCATDVIRPAAAATVHVTYTPLAAGTPAASAILSAHERDADVSNNTVQAGEVLDLSVTLVPSATTVTSGGTLTYTATVKNNGPRDASGAYVTFTAGAGLTLGTLPSGCTASGSQVTCAVSALAAGSSRDLSIPVTASGTGSLTATAAIAAAASAVDTDTTNDSVSVPITSNAPPPPNGGGSSSGGGGGGGSLDLTMLLIGLAAALAKTRRRLRANG